MEEYGESVANRGNWKDFHLYFFQENMSPERCRSTQIDSDQLDPWISYDFYFMGSQSPSPDGIQTSKAFHQAKAGLAPEPFAFSGSGKFGHAQPRSSMDGIYMYTPLYIYIYTQASIYKENMQVNTSKIQ